MMRTSATTVALLALLAVHPAGQGTSPSAGEVAAALQRKYDSVRDFSADFTHQHEGGVLRRKLVEQGTLQVKKPGKMRWEYKSPEKKLFVSNGRRMYFHDPLNNQVTISEVPQNDQATSAAQFLSGRGSLTRDFTASFAKAAPSGPSYALRLEPKTPQNDYDWLEVVVDRGSLQIQSLTAAEKQGGRSTFVFSGLKENIGLADRAFEFEIPRGAEVIHAGPPKR
jgi:outer membrane lipoprotein carrier protein